MDLLGEENGPMEGGGAAAGSGGGGGLLCVSCMSIRICSQKSETE